MSADAVCRVCLVNNLSLYGVRSDLRNVYETITREKYNEAGYPVRMCYICLAALRKCRRFMETARDANSSLKRFYNQQCQMAVSKPLSIYSKSEINVISIENEGISLKYDIKQEKVDLDEQSDINIYTDNFPIPEDVEIEIKPKIEPDYEMQTDNSPLYAEIEIEVKEEIETENDVQLAQANMIHKELDTEMEIEKTQDTSADVFVLERNKPKSENFKTKHKYLKSVSKTKNTVTKNKLNKKTDQTKTTTVEKPYSCSICSHECARKSHLTVHMKTHTAEKPFACKICSFKSAENSQLTRHLKIHTGEKPFKCERCDYKCSEKRNLTDHMRTHTGEKPFSCDLCSYRCSRKDNLANHMRVHTGVKPFSCAVCKRGFAHSSTLKHHVSAKHMNSAVGGRRKNANPSCRRPSKS